MSGQLAGFSLQSCVYVSALSGAPVEVPWSEVASLKTDQIFTLELKGGERVTGALSYSGKAGLMVTSPKMGKIRIDLNELEKFEIASPSPQVAPVQNDTAAQAASDKSQPQDATPPETFGQEELSPPLTYLRGSTVLLKPGQIEGRLTFSYTPTRISQYGQYQRRLYTAALSLNAGLHERLEGWVYIPYGYATGHTTSLVHINYLGRSEKHELMDIGMGFNFLILPESVEFPEMTLSISGTAPTGDSPYLYDELLNLGGGHWTATAGLNFVRSVDPAILFWGVSATHTWPSHVYDQTFSFASSGWSWDYYFGLGMAVNDRLSFSARMLGGYRPALQYNDDNEGRFSNDPMWAGFGFAYRMNETVVVEPQVLFGLNDDAGDTRISVAFSKKFN